MLELLSFRKDATLTKEMFLNHLYGMDEPELKIVDVFICKLRKKLANAFRRPQLHRNGVGPRLRAARAARGRSADPRLILSKESFVRLSPPDWTPPRMAGFLCWGAVIRRLD